MNDKVIQTVFNQARKPVLRSARAAGVSADTAKELANELGMRAVRRHTEKCDAKQKRARQAAKKAKRRNRGV